MKLRWSAILVLGALAAVGCREPSRYAAGSVADVGVPRTSILIGAGPVARGDAPLGVDAPAERYVGRVWGWHAPNTPPVPPPGRQGPYPWAVPASSGPAGAPGHQPPLAEESSRPRG